MRLIDCLLDLSAHAPSERALHLARLSLLDWLACGVAGANEPVAQNLRRMALEEGGAAQSELFGGGSTPARMAALVNGAASHALDYDDTHFAHVGHLSVGIYPAALAVAQKLDASVDDMVTAFLIGAEGAIRIGLVLGPAHYQLGFHQTATAGAFGATLAAGALYHLSPDQMRAALGLCATRASGLKSQFGTMGKPYNAGVAAANGVECAQLARLGMTSADDGLMGAQGFVPTHAPDGAGPVVPPDRALFEDNKYKLHACCHGTHAMIEGLLALKSQRDMSLADVTQLKLRTNPRWLRVCDLKSPRTGLEVKFSYAWLAGMTLRGDATGHDRLYTDDLTSNPVLAEFARRVVVDGDPGLSDMQASGEVTFTDGTTLPFAHDLETPIAVEALRSRLTTKAELMLKDKGTEIWALHDKIEVHSARDLSGLMRAK